MVKILEDKELLLRDLCARLPYGIMCQTDEHGKNYKLKGINKHKGIWWYEFDGFRTIKLPKLYLRPLSSMTKEEDKEYAKVIVKSQYCSFENSESATTMVNDWLLSKGFDVRGLISKGLALEAPEDMYNLNKE